MYAFTSTPRRGNEAARETDRAPALHQPSAKTAGRTARASSNDDTLGRGMEFALVTLVFLLLGLGADALFGTRPWFTIFGVVFAFVGQSTKLYFTYTYRMRRLEAERTEGARAAARPPEPGRER